MKFYTFILLYLIILLNSCGTSNDKSNKQNALNQEKLTHIKGKSTLFNATICIDENSDLICNKDEIKTSSSLSGDYNLTYEGELKEGTILLAINGLNSMLLPQKKEDSVITESASFSKNKVSNDINVFSSLIENSMRIEGLTYTEAVDNWAKEYKLDAKFIDTDPIYLASKRLDLNIINIARTIEAKFEEERLQKEKLNKKTFLKPFEIYDDNGDISFIGIVKYPYDVIELSLVLLVFGDFSKIYHNTENFLLCKIEGSCTYDPLDNIKNPTPQEGDSLNEAYITKDEITNNVWLFEQKGIAPTCRKFKNLNNFRENERRFDLVKDTTNDSLYASFEYILLSRYVFYRSENNDTRFYFSLEEEFETGEVKTISYNVSKYSSFSECQLLIDKKISNVYQKLIKDLEEIEDTNDFNGNYVQKEISTGDGFISFPTSMNEAFNLLRDPAYSIYDILQNEKQIVRKIGYDCHQITAKNSLFNDTQFYKDSNWRDNPTQLIKKSILFSENNIKIDYTNVYFQPNSAESRYIYRSKSRPNRFYITRVKKEKILEYVMLSEDKKLLNGFDIFESIRIEMYQKIENIENCVNNSLFLEPR